METSMRQKPPYYRQFCWSHWNQIVHSNDDGDDVLVVDDDDDDDDD